MSSFFKRIFSKKSDLSSLTREAPYRGKVEVFSRHCIFSEISKNKARLPYFSRKACYQNLLDTISLDHANLTFVLDLARGSKKEHFLNEEKTFPIIEIEEGSEAGAFLRLLDYVSKLELDPETILYFVEDDYLHKEGWTELLLEAFGVEGVEYVTLYDHRDKYFFKEYKNLTSKLFLTKSSHWRTTPSTTQTFAVRFSTLLRDLSVHQKFSKNRKITADHEKFCYLRKRKEILVSPIPGFSTHVEPAYASPFTDWERFFINKEPWDSYAEHEDTHLGK